MKMPEISTDIPVGPERSEGNATTEFVRKFSPPDAPKMAPKLRITEILLTLCKGGSIRANHMNAPKIAKIDQK